MTLKEKLCEPFGGLRAETSKELEEIADNYAIEFSEWCCSRYIKLTNGWFFTFGDIRDRKNWRTTKELLEQFKTEKQL